MTKAKTSDPVSAVLPADERGPQLAVRARRVPNPRAALLLCHGISEHSGRLANLEAMFCDAGCSVFTLDLRGHGRSGNVPIPKGPALDVHIEEFDDFFGDFDRWFEWVDCFTGAEPRILLGHSMGGLIAARYATLRQPAIAGLVCQSAAFRLHLDQRVAAALAGALTWHKGGRVHLPFWGLRALVRKKVRNGLSADPAVWAAFDSDPLVHLRFTARLVNEIGRASRDLLARSERPPVPQLVMHGTKDPLTDVEGSKAWVATCDPSLTRLELFDGMLHELHGEVGRERVFETLRSWLAGVLAELGPE